MPVEDFQSYWLLGYILGAVVVLAVAVLLIAILLVARKIESLAGTALATAGDIETRTKPIWMLGEANRIVTRILDSVRQIEQSARRTASALERTTGGAR